MENDSLVCSSLFSAYMFKSRSNSLTGFEFETIFLLFVFFKEFWRPNYAGVVYPLKTSSPFGHVKKTSFSGSQLDCSLPNCFLS